MAEALVAEGARVRVSGMTGSLGAVVQSQLFSHSGRYAHIANHCALLIAPTKEEAFYLLNDLEALLGDGDCEVERKRVLLFPTSYRRPYSSKLDDEGNWLTDNANELQRTEVIKQLSSGRPLMVVSYPEAMAEKVVSSRTLTHNTLQLACGATLDEDRMIEVMQHYQFERVDFVVEPGQYAIRGGIIDVYSFGSDQPYRIELFDDTIDSLRTFDPVSQLSVRHYDQISIVPNLNQNGSVEQVEQVSLLHYFGSRDIVWVQGLMFLAEMVDKTYNEALQSYSNQLSTVTRGRPDELYSSANDFIHELVRCKIVELGNTGYFTNETIIEAHSEQQPAFNKQFDMLNDTLSDYALKGYQLYLTVAGEQQQRRLDKVLQSGRAGERVSGQVNERASGQAGNARSLLDSLALNIGYLPFQLSQGFVDHDAKVLCFTDHQIFERYHKYTVRDLRQNREALTIKELFELKPGDFVTHIDYGVGRFSGLEKITANGRTQEVIRLVYKNNDTLYISIHGLHKISRYVGKEGSAPTLDRLGSNSWQVLKQRTKKRVKDIAKDLILLYAKRKATRGFAFSADTYMQNELEASFFYEDTPDQHKATLDVKHDMEAPAPMDRLVCGDVGFGKTEVAIRAAFKAACDSKQVAVLVPNTILAFQHYNTFRDRLANFPVRIDYLNRFRSTKDKNQIYKDVESGKIDILVGTHAITNKNLKFKDLGLLIIDEEQKFGVSAKEKLRQMKVNVDCLTLTATPIPRTLQFSLMGARDLSVIQTPPPNRQPIQTELCNFSEELIRDAIMFEMSRGGQTFFVSNRVENMPEMAGLVQRLVPDARVAVAHGQMDGKEVENNLMRFLEGDIDVLVATSIIENGLDIPNANTMIINNAQNFGLSDLHQMRGRVGRSNKKAFCYMLIPSYSSLTPEAQKRMRAIEEFSGIGSGFNIAMRDLDIRGAGNILGAEQSGFISEIGYDMYHKILNEAIDELKHTDFRELFEEELAEENKPFVTDCVIETDLEALLPDDYVTSVSERLSLYKQLSELTTDQELDTFRDHLIDRFGPMPRATQELLLTIPLRREAKAFAIERIVLKNDKMSCFFVADQQSAFYQSAHFGKVIKFIQDHPTIGHLRTYDNKNSLVFNNITQIHQALGLIRQIGATE